MIINNAYLLILGSIIFILIIVLIKNNKTSKFQREKIFSLEASNKELQTTCEITEELKNQKEDAIQAGRMEIEELMLEEENLRRKIEFLTEDLASIRHEKKTLESTHSESLIELSNLRDKFLPLEYRIKDINRFENEINNLQEKIKELNSEKKQISDLYISGKAIYDDLNKEVAALEEKLEMYSFGLYEPHFNFDTSEKFKEEMNSSYKERTLLVKNDQAVKCYTEWTINGDKAAGRRQTRHYTKMMLRAFNGECDATIARVKWNNVQTMELRIMVSFNAINKLGESHNILIQQEYRDIRIKELRLAYEYQEKVYEEREEQRRIREQIREEERALREMEAAREEAEKEEERYTKALAKAKRDLESKHGIEKDELLIKITQLEENLKKAGELKQRAISMAQITKSGYVYVISNVGSFGENVYKIGMTRRLEPTDRVRELSGASVPFSFDVHAMIYSKNAPELESNFHKKFKTNRVNWVNGRKEFFQVSLEEIERVAHELEHGIEFIKVAEARDYRETRALLEKYQKIGAEKYFDTRFPDHLFDDDFDDEDVQSSLSSSSIEHDVNFHDANGQDNEQTDET